MANCWKLFALLNRTNQFDHDKIILGVVLSKICDQSIIFRLSVSDILWQNENKCISTHDNNYKNLNTTVKFYHFCVNYRSPQQNNTARLMKKKLLLKNCAHFRRVQEFRSAEFTSQRVVRSSEEFSGKFWSDSISAVPSLLIKVFITPKSSSQFSNCNAKSIHDDMVNTSLTLKIVHSKHNMDITSHWMIKYKKM